jgi:tetratricopeptide (TPR) repeat protein
LEPDHPEAATNLNNLAEFYRSQGKYADAEPLYKRALTIDKKALGPDHPDVAGFVKSLAADLYAISVAIPTGKAHQSWHCE